MPTGFLLNSCSFSMVSSPATVYFSSQFTRPPSLQTLSSSLPHPPFSVDAFPLYFSETMESNTRKLPHPPTSKPIKLLAFVIYSVFSLMTVGQRSTLILRLLCPLVHGILPLLLLSRSLPLILCHFVSPPAVRMVPAVRVLFSAVQEKETSGKMKSKYFSIFLLLSQTRTLRHCT